MLPFKWTDCIQSSTYDCSHCSTAPLKPYVTSGRRSKMSWSTVSKAAVKSSSGNSAILPLAIASTISENTFNTAVFV